jgi:pimeloyl-ACP methyl ester carboxylesterase
MRRPLLGLTFAAALAATAAVAPRAAADGGDSGDHQIVATQQVRIGGFVRTDWTVQVGANPLNRFGMHRLVKGSGERRSRAALLLLPPLGNGFSFFEVDENGRYDHSLAAFFAARDFEVWGYSPRTSGLIAGVCESGALDCSAMAHWGIQAVVDDADFLRQFMAQGRDEEIPVVVGGYSLGGMTTIATMNAHPGDYAGAMVLEGALYAADPAVVALNAGFCSGLEAQLAAGQIFDDTTLPGIRGIVGLAKTNPNGPTPLPGFPPGTTNHQVMVFLLAVPQVGPLWPTHDFIRCAGSVPEDRFFFSTDARVIAHSLLFNDYVDNVSIRDVSCSLAGERTFTGNLAAWKAPVYLLAGGRAFLAQQNDLATILGSTDVTRNFIVPFGHADHWFSADHREILEEDILRWLDRILPEGGEGRQGGLAVAGHAHLDG